VKGAVVGWLLDARIRVSTGGSRCLDDLMRLAFARFSGDRGFSQAEFRAVAEEVAGARLDEFFRRAVESTEELDYGEALEWFGLRFKKPHGSGRASIGAETKNESGRLVVGKVPRGTAAFDAGLSVDDEIVAIDGFRVRADQLAGRLENYEPGAPVELLVARREKMMRVGLQLGEEAGRVWQLEVRPSPSEEQKARLKDWLS
jgi:predicted metalloprotease with PDZ domain